MLAPNPMAGQIPMPEGQMAGAPMPMPGPSVQMGGQLPMTMPPAAPPPRYHDITIVTKKSYSCARVEGVPPEEFGIARNARTIKDCGYCFHEVIKTESDLIGQGYDDECIKKLPSYTTSTTSESLRRDTVDEGRSNSSGDSGSNTANREVLITEHYVRMDYDGKGKPAKLYRVTTGSEQGDILTRNKGKEDIEEIDEIPFAAMTPVIVTHRFFGRSIADLVMDIQRIKTALLRGALDNLYLHNNPRVEVSDNYANESTLDDLLVSRPGGIVRTKQPGGLNWQVVPDITGSVYPALQYFDAVREWRTGVSRQGQGVDPNALQNQVATIANQMADAAQAKTKLIARIFAETGIKDMFMLLHGIIRKNGQQAETVRLRNKWVDVDPRDWQERNDMTINVGLGTGNKQQQLAMTQLIGAAQEKMIPLGIVSKKNVYETAKEITKLAGHRDPDKFWTAPDKQPDPNDPASAPIPPPQDPKQAEIAAKQQAEQAKMAADQQHQQAQFQRDTAHERMKLESDTQIQHTKTQAEIALAQQKFELERELKLIDARIKQEQHQNDMAIATQKHQLDRDAMMQKAHVDENIAHRKAKIDANSKLAKPGTQLNDDGDVAVHPELKAGIEGIANAIAQSHQQLAEHMTKPRKARIKAPSGKVYEVES